MIKNFFIASLRNLRKKPGFTLVNVIGLALGMATCLSIYLFVDYDLSYDRFQDSSVYRIALNRIYPERQVKYTLIPHSVGPQLALDYPEVVAQTRFFQAFAPITFRFGEKSYNERKIIFADSSIFSVIQIPLKSGDTKTALANPDGIILTESMAQKIFGTVNPIGKSLEVQGGKSVLVTAVAKDYPKNSHLTFDYIIPLKSIPFFDQANWLGFTTLTYIKLQPGTDPKIIENRLPETIKQYADEQMKARNGISYEEYIAAGNGYDYFLQPIQDIHLHSQLEGEIKPNGNISYIYIFSAVAIFILLIACINFMNLSTARSTERGKEVGIRKVLGSNKTQLIGQFLTEAFLITLLSGVTAIILVGLLLPSFAHLADRPLTLMQLLKPTNLLVISGLIVLISLLAGAYPAFFISSFQPIMVLKGKFRSSTNGIALRNILVVTQFTISIALISATILVYEQMSYLVHKPLGYDKENILVVENAFALNNDTTKINWSRYKTFQNRMNELSSVQDISYTSAMPGDILPGFIIKNPRSTEKESLVTRNINFGNEMITTLGLKMNEGRFFSNEFNDSLSMILNLSAVEKLGIQDPIGKKIINIVGGDDNVEYTIIGIIEDFHFQSLHVAMEPVAITSLQSQNGFPNKMVIRLNPENTQKSLLDVTQAWNEFVPNSPFQSYFLDSNLEDFYKAEKSTGTIFTTFTLLAIIIACIGLLGLSAFIINQRVKEIGVRKVLGATVVSIMVMLSRDFSKLIGISALIAIPLSYLWMKNWMQGFAYATNISWTIFLFASLLALVVGLGTVSIQSAKAALSNPVNSLKDE